MDAIEWMPFLGELFFFFRRIVFLLKQKYKSFHGDFKSICEYVVHKMHSAALIYS